MATLQSTLRVSLIDHATGPANAIVGTLGRLRAAGQGMFAPFNTGLGRLAAFGIGFVGLRSGIEETVGAARTMEVSLTEIGIKAGLTTTQIGKMRRDVVALGPDVNQTTTELLGGVDAMVTLGLSADQAVAALPAIGRAATASMAQVNDLAAASVSAMQNLEVAPDQIGRMLDGMTAAGNAGAFEMRDMAAYFPELTANAKALGMSGVDAVYDLAAALQIARRGTGDASSAANNLGEFMGKIMAPQTVKNFKKFGVDVTKELKKAHKQGISPIEHFVKLIDEKTKGGRADLLGQLFGDKQALEFLRPMLADFKDYIRIRDEAEQSTGAAAEAYARRMQDAEQKIKSFRIQMENIGTSIGGKVLGPLGDVAGRIAYLIDTADRRVNIFDQFQARFDAFAQGLGQGDGMTMLKSIGDMLEGGIFGREAMFDRDVENLTIAAQGFRNFGQAVRDMYSDLTTGDVAGLLRDFKAAFGELSTGMTFGSLVTLSLAGTGLRMLAGGALALASSRFGQLFLVALAISSVIEAAQGAESIGEFVDNLSELSSLEMLGIGAGLFIIGSRARFAVKWLRQLANLKGGAAVAAAATAGAGVPAGASAAPKTASWLTRWLRGAGTADLVGSGRASTQLTALETVGKSIGAMTPKLAAVLGKVAGLPAMAGEVTTRALLATPPSDPSLINPERAAERDNYYRQFHGVQFEGGWHRAGLGAAPMPGARQQIDDIKTSIESSTKDWPAAAQQGIQQYAEAIAQGGATAEAEADRIGTGIEEALSVTGRPDVDTSKLQAALKLARELGVAIRLASGRIGPATSVPVVDGARAAGGPVRGGGTYLVGEKGPELVEFGQSGMVRDARTTAEMLAADGPQRSVAGRRHLEINLGGVTFHINAAPGQSPESIAAAVERHLSAKLTELSNRAFHDGVY